jgi:hypothetical protein
LKEDPKDAIEFVREVVRSALWKVSYHDKELAKAYANLGFAKQLMKRGDFDEEAERADVDSDGADSVFENVTQFACDILDNWTEAVEYHERALKQAHANAAFAKIMLARGNYTETDSAKIEESIRATKEQA